MDNQYDPEFCYAHDTVGFWVLPKTDICYACYEKPRWLTRVLMRYLLEWQWCERHVRRR